MAKREQTAKVTYARGRTVAGKADTPQATTQLPASASSKMY